jgi:hypothetical protein
MDPFASLGFKPATPKSFAESANDPFASLGFKPANATPEPAKPFRYDVAPVVEDQQTKIKRLQAEAAVAEKQSKKDNSFLGMAGNFGKAVVENIAPSEVGLGKSIGKIATNPQATLEQHNALIDSNMKLRKIIAKRQAEGLDVSGLMRSYNSTQDLIDELGGELQGHADNLPTTKAVLGQLGGTALDVLTAGTYGRAAQGAKSFTLASKASPVVKSVATAVSPELGKIAEQKASGLFTKKGLGNVLKGGGIGYGYDVTQNAQNDKENVFKPGMGTAIGLGIPLVSGAVQSTKNAFNKDIKANNLIEKRKKDLAVLEDYNSVSNVVQKHKDRGINVPEIVAGTDLLHGAVDKNGVISTKGDGGAIDQVQKLIKPAEGVIAKNLEREGKSLPLSVIEKKLQSAVDSSGLEGAALTKAHREVAADLAGYARRALPNGEIPLATIHSAKIDKYSNINFMTEAEKQKSGKAIAKALKELVESNTQSVDVKKLNEELSRHYAVINYLEKLDGKRVEGGRLGKHFARVLGGIVGSHFGPLGSIAGAELAGGIKGLTMSSKFGGKIGKSLGHSDAMQKAIDRGNSLKVKHLPSEYTNELPTIDAGTVPKKVSTLPVAEGAPKVYSNNLGALTKSQTTQSKPMNKGIGKIVPPGKDGASVKKKDNLASVIEAFQRDKSLTGKDAQVQEASIRKFVENKDEMVGEYLKKNGNVVNTDEARKLFKDVGYVGKNSRAVQEASSAVAKEAWKKLLKTSKSDTAVIFAGGSGTGKTSAVKTLIPDEIGDAGAVLDGNLSTMGSATSRIQEVLDAGKKPLIAYVYRDPVEAWVEGVVKRMKLNKEEGGRIVPLSVFLENHKGSYEVTKKLLESKNLGKEYDVALIDNSLGYDKHDLLNRDKFDTIHYDADLADTLKAKTKKLYEQKQITKDEYEELLK